MSTLNLHSQRHEKVVHNAAHYRSKVATRARQELLQSLGELYRKAYNMFEASSYLRILALVDLLIRCPLTARTESTPHMKAFHRFNELLWTYFQC
ncbi:hypothetical protein O6H91_13G067600 [Diphasiastrum complanatum]|uniref:Uncharacterized protein n=1 Tax=Diphasiastrum complanatum TaxID=34168 RepID=A0ACC2BVT1_DIPCM|nr:hypothetical protein O6H91_13G067600 [Diphasiastrum complanatum]